MKLCVKRLRIVSSIILIISIAFTSFMSITGIIKNKYVLNLERDIYYIMDVPTSDNPLSSNTYLYSLVVENKSIRSILNELNNIKQIVKEDKYFNILKEIKSIVNPRITSGNIIDRTIGSDYLHLLILVVNGSTNDEMNEYLSVTMSKNSKYVDTFALLCNIINIFIILTIILTIFYYRKNKVVDSKYYV